MRKLILLFFLLSYLLPGAQPYIDIVRFNYTYSPKQGLNEKTSPLRSNFFTADVTFPIELKKGGDAIIINPFFTNNEGEVSSNDFHAVSEALLIGFLKKDIFQNWNLLSSFIVRRNTDGSVDSGDGWQYGGIILATWKKSQDL